MCVRACVQSESVVQGTIFSSKTVEETWVTYRLHVATATPCLCYTARVCGVGYYLFFKDCTRDLGNLPSSGRHCYTLFVLHSKCRWCWFKDCRRDLANLPPSV